MIHKSQHHDALNTSIDYISIISCRKWGVNRSLNFFFFLVIIPPYFSTSIWIPISLISKQPEDSCLRILQIHPSVGRVAPSAPYWQRQHWLLEPSMDIILGVKFLNSYAQKCKSLQRSSSWDWLNYLLDLPVFTWKFRRMAISYFM